MLCKKKGMVAYVGHCRRYLSKIPPDIVIPRPKLVGKLTQINLETNPWILTIVSEDDWYGDRAFVCLAMAIFLLVFLCLPFH